MFDATNAAYALLLGMVAAFNPCGFALLPAYVTVLVTGSSAADVPRAVAVRRAVGFGLAMTLGFMVVFTGFGLLFGAVNAGLQGSVLPYVSYVTTVLGLVVIVLGVVLVKTGELSGPGLRIKGHAPRSAFWSQVAYGASFALASLSCTIGLFLVIVTQALDATSPVGAVAPFVIYAAGMGTSLVLVSLAAALLGSGAAAAFRRHTMALMRTGGVLMILAGLYVLVFGLAEILPQHGVHALDGVLLGTSQAQGRVTQAIASWGTPMLVVLLVAAGVAVAWVFARRSRKGDRQGS